MKGFGDRLKMLRKEMNLKQAELAELIDVSRASLSAYENDERVPDIDTLRSICEKCQISPAWMLGMDEQAVKILTVTHSDVENAIEHLQNAIEHLQNAISILDLRQGGQHGKSRPVRQIRAAPGKRAEALL